MFKRLGEVLPGVETAPSTGNAPAAGSATSAKGECMCLCPAGTDRFVFAAVESSTVAVKLNSKPAATQEQQGGCGC